MLSTRRLRVVAGLLMASLVAVVAVSAGTSATDQSTTIRIWADADRTPAVTQVANAWAQGKNVNVQVVQKDFGQIRSQLTTVARRHGAGRHRRRARLDRRAVRERLGPARSRRPRRRRSSSRRTRSTRSRTARRSRSSTARPSRSRTSRSSRTRSSRRCRSRSPTSSAGARGEEEDEGAGRPRRPAGRDRRRVPHVPVLLRPRWLHLR